MYLTPDGQLSLLTSATDTNRHADAASTSEQKQQGAAGGPDFPPEQQQQQRFSYLLATLLRTLSTAHASVSTHLLQQLLPQMLSCQLPFDTSTAAGHSSSSSSSSGGGGWVSTLCRTAAELHARGHPAAQQLAVSCVKLLESSSTPKSSSSSAAAATAAARAGSTGTSGLTLGQHTYLQLLAALLQSPLSDTTKTTSKPVQHTQQQQQQQQHTHSVHKQQRNTVSDTAAPAAVAAAGLLSPQLLQRLLECVVPQISSGRGTNVVYWALYSTVQYR